MTDTIPNESGSAEATEAKRSAAARLMLFLIVAVCLIGLGVSVELTHIHYQSHTNPDFKSICAVSEAVNCETVARSPWSVFLGLPISVWGMLAYALFASMGILALVRRLSITGFFLLGFSLSLIASALLAYISTFLIRSICLFCTTLYVVNVALFVLAIVSIRVGKQSPLHALKSNFRQMRTQLRFWLPLGTIFIVMAILAHVLIPPYWSRSRFDSLPPMETGITADGAYWIGAAKPLVTLVEFSDFECPFCRRAHFQTRMMIARYKNEVRLVHRHMPMDNKCNEYLEKPFHDRACEFARAAECAGEQGKFWEMNDALFGAQETMSAMNVDLDALAHNLNLDESNFQECLSSQKIAQKIGADVDDAMKRKLPGTPTYFVGAQPYPGGIPEQTLQKYIQRAKNPESGQN